MPDHEDDEVYVPPEIEKDDDSSDGSYASYAPNTRPRRNSRVKVKDENTDEEIVIEVEINANELDPFINELQYINGLITEITCADDDTEDRLRLDSYFEDQNYIANGVDPSFYLDDSFDNIREIDFPINVNDIKQEHKDPFLLKDYSAELANGTFMCPQCMNIYRTKKALNRHIREFHDRSTVAKCDRCDYEAANAGALTAHVQVVHLKIFRYECPKCDDMKTQRKIHLVRHLKEAHEIEESEASTYIKSKTRMKNRAIGTVHMCKRCPYSSPSKSALKKHVERKHRESWAVPAEVVCHLCHEEFLDVDSKDRHPCPVRAKIKETVDAIAASEDGKFLCPVCYETFDERDILRNHYTMQHPPTPPSSLAKANKRLKGMRIKKEDPDNLSGTATGDGTYLWYVKNVYIVTL